MPPFDGHSLFVLNLAATLYMTGLIWFVQLVHYRLYPFVGAETFVTYQARHVAWTTAPVLPVMACELATAVLLVRTSPLYMPPPLAAVGLGLVLLLWVSTFAIQVPLHRQLEQGYIQIAARRLMQTNWIRTAIWTLRSIGLLIILRGALG